MCIIWKQSMSRVVGTNVVCEQSVNHVGNSNAVYYMRTVFLPCHCQWCCMLYENILSTVSVTVMLYVIWEQSVNHVGDSDSPCVLYGNILWAVSLVLMLLMLYVNSLSTMSMTVMLYVIWERSVNHVGNSNAVCYMRTVFLPCRWRWCCVLYVNSLPTMSLLVAMTAMPGQVNALWHAPGLVLFQGSVLAALMNW